MDFIETKTILSEFEVIENHINLINEIENISEISPQHYPFDLTFQPRDGKNIENEDIDNLIRNCDKVSDREIEVPKVVG